MSIVILYSSYLITQEKISSIKVHEYSEFSKTIRSKLQIHIQAKQKLTTFIALALAQNSTLREALLNNDKNLIDIKNLSQVIQEHSQYNNLWYQVLDNKGNSFFRSWVDKSGDSLIKQRPEISKILNTPQILSTISTGKFSMSFKSMVPIYSKDQKLLGIFEVISHFNSISYQLFEDEHVETLFIVDKRYKAQLTKPFSKLFIDQYYISNLSPSKEIIKLLEDEGMAHFLNSKQPYSFDKNSKYIIVSYDIPDIENNPMGYALAFKKVAMMPHSNIKAIKENITTLIIALIFIFMLIAYLFIQKRHHKEILEQYEKHQEDLIKNTKFLTIGQIAAGITHEINTPLTYIKGTLEMLHSSLLKLPKTKEKADLLEDQKTIYNGINRIGIIIESMREMSQSTLSQKERFNIYSTIIIVLRMIHNKAKQVSRIYVNNKLFDIDTSDKEEEQYFALIHIQRIEQVWTIILNNALDELAKIDNYEKRRIDINIYKKEKKLIIDFIDTAGGIEESIYSKIFEPFVSSKESSGVGIGLNVAKKIIEEHQGEIKVKNTKNGACFSIILDDMEEY